MKAIRRQRVLLDGYYLGRPFGYGRMTVETCRALGRSAADVDIIVAVPDDVDVTLLVSYPFLTWHRLPRTNLVVWEQFLVPRLARALSCDVVHFLSNTSAAYTFGITKVTTVHDLMFLHANVYWHQPRAYLHYLYTRFAFNHFSQKSTPVVSISKATHSALAHRGTKSVVVYNTTDGFIAEHAPSVDRHIGRRYVLHRGGFTEHRNTRRVIEAFNRARPTIGDVDLRILGAVGGEAVWRTEDEPSVQFLPRMSDADLASLYAEASCVMVTSLEEGFGLPIIEAFGFGAPVITSNIDPMREIAGDAALLVDPNDIDAMARELIALLLTPNLAASLIAKGHERRKRFSSERLGAELLNVYRNLGYMNGPKGEDSGRDDGRLYRTPFV